MSGIPVMVAGRKYEPQMPFRCTTVDIYKPFTVFRTPARVVRMPVGGFRYAFQRFADGRQTIPDAG
jgi:hypothetical protein